jgi:DNA invertase Pin-like site-specific DNA recombinase
MEPGKLVSIRRCAIYTRKSSEEGLEQGFNSLHAQREACEAFIKSQAGEGWRLISTAYDDGGISGGTMERPALKRLLADISSGGVDVLIVYKVDRLTRSLSDFAKMVEVFDAHGVSFVAVTQQFNTTTSMGRLTLNVLLSFAQFEREVTGERIRDKIAASRRKGLWMGGMPPLGYDVRDSHLVINEAEATTLKLIYELYLKLGSVRLLKHELDRRGVISKLRVSRKGSSSGGFPFSRGALYELLANPVYVGQVRHRKQVHPGQHPAILERGLWEKVQHRLRGRAARGARARTKATISPLAGKLLDEHGQPLYVQGAAKGRRRYRYYVSRALVRGSAEPAGGGWRIPAPEMERVVAGTAKAFLDDRPAMLVDLQEAEIEIPDVREVFRLASELSRRLSLETERAAALVEIVEKVRLAKDSVGVGFKIPLPKDDEEARQKILRFNRRVPMRMKRRGVELRIIVEGQNDLPLSPDPALLRAVARARRWFEEIASGRVRSSAEIARREGLQKGYVARLTRLASLSPTVVEMLIEGRTPAGLNLQSLMARRLILPPTWRDQERLLMIPKSSNP